MLIKIKLLPSKTNCSNKFFILKLRENSSFDNFTDCIEGTKYFPIKFEKFEKLRKLTKQHAKDEC